MRIEEARRLAEWIEQIGLPRGAVCLNIGSSTGEFRTSVQPHIDAILMRRIAAAGLRIVHCDLKAAEGVDEVGDVLQPAFRERLKRYDASLILCSNLLEHLDDPEGFAAACGDLIGAGAYGIFSVPLSYPYHPDPIDTMLRLSPKQLAAMLPGWHVRQAEVIAGGNHWRDLRASGEPFARLVKQVGRTMLPMYRSSQWKQIAHRLLWLVRPFTVSAVLLRKPA
jgi:hypothetical protein